MEIRKEVTINAPLKVVWSVFARMEDWQQWNTVCRNCCYVEGSQMDLGTCFSFEIKPLLIPLKVQPRITKCEPGREVVWKGGRFGVQAEHSFEFFDRGDSVRLVSVEVFKGPLVGISRLLQVPQRLHRLTGEFMQAIKQHAEACAA